MLDRAKLEAQLTQLPLYQYAFLKPEELPFSTRLQTVCRENCPMYGKSWSCPPRWGRWTPAVPDAWPTQRRCWW